MKFPLKIRQSNIFGTGQLLYKCYLVIGNCNSLAIGQSILLFFIARKSNIESTIFIV